MISTENFKWILRLEEHPYEQTVPQQNHTTYLCRLFVYAFFSSYLENIILALA